MGLYSRAIASRRLGGLRQGHVVRGNEVTRRIGAGPARKVGGGVGKRGPQPAGEECDQLCIRRFTLLQHVFPGRGQGLGERLGRGIDPVGQGQQLVLAPLVGLPAIPPSDLTSSAVRASR